MIAKILSKEINGDRMFLAVSFTEGSFSEVYTFFLPIEDQESGKSLDQRISDRIKEEVDIYKTKKATADSATQATNQVQVQVGDEIKF